MGMILRRRAARGADRLDIECPGWAKGINENILDLRSGLDCVLGQVFGNYGKGLRQLNLDSFFGPVRHGFHVSILPGKQKAARRQKVAWIPLIQERKAAAAVA